MSSGPFEIGRYQCEATGDIHPVRVQPETKALIVNGVTNAYPAGNPNSPVSAQISQSKRALGINTRTVTIKFPTAAPDNYKVGEPIRLPWFTPFPTPAFIKGQAVTYLGATGELVSFDQEKVN
jgi:hypothetical protein